MRATELNVPSAEDPTRRAIVNELYFALAKLGAADELLAIVGSWGATLWMTRARSIISERSTATARCVNQAICRAD
jgi:hypothetical protein